MNSYSDGDISRTSKNSQIKRRVSFKVYSDSDDSDLDTPSLNSTLTSNLTDHKESQIAYQPILKKSSSKMNSSIIKKNIKPTKSSKSSKSSRSYDKDEESNSNIISGASDISDFAPHGADSDRNSVSAPQAVGSSTHTEELMSQLNMLLKNNKILKVSSNSYDLIPFNTHVCYVTKVDNVVFNKYFKSINLKKQLIKFGFSRNPRHKEYNIDLDFIKALYTYGYVKSEGEDNSSDSDNSSEESKDDIQGGTRSKVHKKQSETNDNLRNTIIIDKKDWVDIQPGTTISYLNKNTKTYVYRAKFNSLIISQKNGKTSFSLTNKTGTRYFINPDNISKIYRHILSIDLTILQLLKSITDLTARVEKLESNKV